MTTRRWFCSQIGAREHYAIPRALHARDALRTLCTDVWADGPARLLRFGPAAARAFAGRFHPDLPPEKVVAFTRTFLWDRLRHRGSLDRAGQFGEYLRLGRMFAELVNRQLARRPLDPERDAFLGYNTGSLETLQWLRERGVPTVVDQIDPGRFEEEIVCQEARKWPGWQKLPGQIPETYFHRLSAEWEAADTVLVNSEWSRQALLRQHVPAEKLVVIPLSYEGPRQPVVREARRGPLTVLWLGGVVLRKGIPYLMQAARALADLRMRFIVAGPVGISPDAVATAPPNLTFTGPITRDRVSEFYRDADVFVLPTLSDGFAITQLEAMAHGLPVVTTPNCGEVVTDGVDGRIVPAGDGSALAAALAELNEDRSTLRAMSAAAPEKARQFSLGRLANRLEQVFGENTSLMQEAMIRS